MDYVKKLAVSNSESMTSTACENTGNSQQHRQCIRQYNTLLCDVEVNNQPRSISLLKHLA